MLQAMSMKVKSYEDTPEGALSPMSVYSSSKNIDKKEGSVKTNVSNAIKRGNIPSDMTWILK